MIPSKYLSNFWRTHEMQLINCTIDFIVTWSNNCLTSNAAANKKATVAITDTKCYVLIVTLLAKDNVKLSQQLKSGLKLTVNWNKHQSKTTTQNVPKQIFRLFNWPNFSGSK